MLIMSNLSIIKTAILNTFILDTKDKLTEMTN